jgi:hypothetical protein
MNMYVDPEDPGKFHLVPYRASLHLPNEICVPPRGETSSNQILKLLSYLLPNLHVSPAEAVLCSRGLLGGM